MCVCVCVCVCVSLLPSKRFFACADSSVRPDSPPCARRGTTKFRMTAATQLPYTIGTIFGGTHSGCTALVAACQRSYAAQTVSDN